MKKLWQAGLLFLLALISGCHHRNVVTARSEYLQPSYLASAKIDTPDPCRGCFTGQQLVIAWNVPARCLPAQVDLRVRYGDRSFKEISYPIDEVRGFWIYRLMNEDFWKLKGIMAFSAQVSSCGQVLGTWNHHLWADLIEVGPAENMSD